MGKRRHVFYPKDRISPPLVLLFNLIIHQLLLPIIKLLYFGLFVRYFNGSLIWWLAILIIRLNLAQLFVYKGLTICLAVVIGIWLQRDRSKRVGTNELVFIRVIFSLEFLVYRKAV